MVMYNSCTFYHLNSLTSFDIYAFAQKVIRFIHILIETNPRQNRLEYCCILLLMPHLAIEMIFLCQLDLSEWCVPPEYLPQQPNICLLVKEAIIIDVVTI